MCSRSTTWASRTLAAPPSTGTPRHGVRLKRTRTTTTSPELAPGDTVRPPALFKVKVIELRNCCKLFFLRDRIRLGLNNWFWLRVFKDFFHLAHLLNNLRTTCMATSGPAEGSACVFPFNFMGVSHFGCTTIDGDTTPWCSTMTDENNDHVSGVGAWGYCDASCPLQGLSQS